MATREHGISLLKRGPGRFRRVNFGRNDTRLIVKNPAYRKLLRAAERRLDGGQGLRVTTAELREMLEIEP